MFSGSFKILLILQNDFSNFYYPRYAKILQIRLTDKFILFKNNNKAAFVKLNNE